MENIHFGHMIQAELKRQGRTVTWFARAIHCDRTNAYKIFANSHIDTELLLRISRVLGHNFFQDAANHLKEQDTI
ncbi:MAG: XRE family transcriptional regulator [Bacteroidales bacterium]|nr:XRE family transcriptional regulator [Bacteroidales bacterium]